MHMGSRLMKSIRKNLFGVITLVLSAGVLLAFLFSSDGINSLKEISKTIQYHSNHDDQNPRHSSRRWQGISQKKDSPCQCKQNLP